MTATANIKVEGGDALRRALIKAGELGRTALKSGLYAEGNAILGVSQVEVPVDTGTLRSSGHVELPKDETGGRVVVEIGYGGAAQGYALIVHERMDLKHVPPGKAKYLEDPALRAITGMGQRLSSVVYAHLKRLERGV